MPLGFAPMAGAATDGPGGLGRPELPEPRASEVSEVTGLGAEEARELVAASRAENEAQAEEARRSGDAAGWPEPGEDTAAPSGDGSAALRPGGLPVELRVPRSAKAAERPAGAGRAGSRPEVEVLDQEAARAAGVTGVLLTADLPAPDGTEVSVDYSGFAGAIGGDWAGRLRLVELPGCALTTPQKPECREQTPLDSVNDRAGQTVTARIGGSPSGADGAARTAAASGPAVLAVTAASAGSGGTGSGDYSATPLSESATWEAGGSSGSFTWSYALDLPPVAAGPSPGLSLSYDSGSVDGRTATTNNQGSQVGEGFSLTESYIERSYTSCDKDGHDDVHDRCWKFDNATLVLNGLANQLVKDDATGRWRLENDDASTVTRSTGAANGDDNGEHWTVVTGDGTRYVFGLHKLPGAGTERTHSVWTVPVFGDDSGEPGYSQGGTFADRSVTQAWRWNLDYVEDTHGNVATYWYTKETNHYKKNGASSADTAYTRGGYLTRIDYGQRKDSLFTRSADARVRFFYAERCTAADCTDLNEDTADNWPDVPFDALCTSGDTDCLAESPAFFTRKRLTGIASYSWNASSAAYDKVDSWDLTQDYLDPGDIGDTSDNTLVLTSLQRTGHTGTAITVNPVEFTYHMRPNRVDAVDDILPLHRPRLNTVTSETGGIITVTYSEPECRRSELTGAAEDTNTRSCFPQYWHINGAQESSVDWFHKYRVEAVVLADPTGHNEPVEHAYAYSGAAWAYNHDPFLPESDRTWSQWRGYRKVTTRTGNLQAVRTATTSVFFQGMHGDRLADGSARSRQLTAVSLPGLAIPAVTDHEQYAGMIRQSITYDGATALSTRVHEPWSRTTATQSVPDARDAKARYVRIAKTTDHTLLTATGAWRSRTQRTTYDDYGMARLQEDLGQDGVSGDETCTRTWYARNDALGIIATTSRERTVARPCSAGEADLDLPADSSRRGDVLNDTATVYDNPDATGWSPGQQPVKGEVTWSGRPTGYPAAAGSGERHPTGWQTVMTNTHDALGRVVSATDAAGNTTTTAFTPADGGPVTRITVTNPLGHIERTFYDPRRALALRSYDANLKKTELTHDALGRITAVWLPNRNRAAGYGANLTFEYRISNTGQSSIATSRIKADGTSYLTTYEIYDSLLRPLQTQAPAAQGGRLLTDTRYDSAGRAFQTYADIFDPATEPKGTYARAEYGEAPRQHNITFDGAGRTVADTLLVYGTERWTTETSYTGDSTATSAVTGGTAARTVVDVRGRTVERRSYNGPDPEDPDWGGAAGSGHLATRFEYAPDGRLLTLTDPGGAVRTHSYDLYGRTVEIDDPTSGRLTKQYNALDLETSRTDARGETVLTRYDALGRPTGTWAGTVSDATRMTGHTYDGLVKGHPESSTRYVGGTDGLAYTRQITAYDSLYRVTGEEMRLDADDPLVAAGAPQTIPLAAAYRIDGTLGSVTEPALGGLPQETVSYERNALGLVTKVTGAAGYLLHADYSPQGRPQQLTLGLSSSPERQKTYLTQTYEEGTGRLLRSHVTDQTHPYMLQDLNYRYDDAGNVLSIEDPTHLGGTSAADLQCFSYDGQRRLTDVWTPAAGDCSTGNRSASNLGGPAPHWTSYSYDNASGSRTGETRRTAGGTQTTAYCYTDPARPYALTGLVTDGTCAGEPDQEFRYDDAGNTTGRPGPAGDQQLSWNSENRLARAEDTAGTTEYLYDADGGLLIRRNPDGESVLYAGSTEFRLEADGRVWAQRYYAADDRTVAVRTNDTGQEKVHYLAGDQYGTSSLAVEALNQDFAKRYTMPFGSERTEGAIGTWVDDKGFLGKTDDPGTGLVQVGARQYDPQTGRFLSPDPVLDVTSADQMQGYSYARNNPLTYTDPSGLLDCNMLPPEDAAQCRGWGSSGSSKRSSGGSTNFQGNPGTPGNTGSSGTWFPHGPSAKPAGGGRGTSGGDTRPAASDKDLFLGRELTQEEYDQLTLFNFRLQMEIDRSLTIDDVNRVMANEMIVMNEVHFLARLCSFRSGDYDACYTELTRQPEPVGGDPEPEESERPEPEVPFLSVHQDMSPLGYADLLGHLAVGDHEAARETFESIMRGNVYEQALKKLVSGSPAGIYTGAQDFAHNPRDPLLGPWRRKISDGLRHLAWGFGCSGGKFC
ncbi:RHS repeat domain-containing protein [Streptomyces sp. YIM 98790]|uniref:RHS repeat domain-containing protein n=1 Tax=Streptomyces sp. YIM 98790 TaxID=2689077 RepID=UPI00140BAE18|nr:RHS repeat-associated core domain-containing protein [Streptomyces sp. YIM 98790]